LTHGISYGETRDWHASRDADRLKIDEARRKGKVIVAGIFRAILFDLDDTLLENNMDRFLPAYFGLLTPHMASYVPPDKFMSALLAATRAMVENTDPTLTNQQVFAADFFPRVGRTADELMPVFEDFYATQFGQLRSLTRCRPEARAVVQAVFDAGLDVVIATNPLFPETAIRQRMEWADVADFPFRLVTSYETMHACKPHSQYYQEIAECIGRKASECVMVGDDWKNDIAPALQAGLRTYWVNTSTKALDPKGWLNPSGLEFDPPAHGTLADFSLWLAQEER
jgi:HAD superfamily hydrolase (TIGR01549 family)